MIRKNQGSWSGSPVSTCMATCGSKARQKVLPHAITGEVEAKELGPHQETPKSCPGPRAAGVSRSQKDSSSSQMPLNNPHPHCLGTELEGCPVGGWNQGQCLF